MPQMHSFVYITTVSGLMTFLLLFVGYSYNMNCPIITKILLCRVIIKLFCKISNFGYEKFCNAIFLNLKFNY